MASATSTAPAHGENGAREAPLADALAVTGATKNAHTSSTSVSSSSSLSSSSLSSKSALSSPPTSSLTSHTAFFTDLSPTAVSLSIPHRPDDPVVNPSFSGLVPSSLRTRLSQVKASPPIKRLLATKSLVRLCRDPNAAFSDLDADVRLAFGVHSPSVFFMYRRLLDSELLSYAELAAAAGNGELLTATVRSVLADCPEIVSAYDAGAASRRPAVANNWRPFEGRDCLPGTRFTALALQREREAGARASRYAVANPLGDGGRSHRAREAALWEEAERKVVG
jgi:hypothetical protein